MSEATFCSARRGLGSRNRLDVNGVALECHQTDIVVRRSGARLKNANQFLHGSSGILSLALLLSAELIAGEHGIVAINGCRPAAQ